MNDKFYNEDSKEIVPTYSDNTYQVKRVGHINMVHEKGGYNGCYFKMFTGYSATDVEAKVNEWFTSVEHAVLTIELRPVTESLVYAIYTRKQTPAELEHINRIAAKIAEEEEKEKHEKLAAEMKVRDEIDARNAALVKERKRKQDIVERLSKWGMKYLKNVKKASKAEQQEAEETLNWFKHMDDESAPVTDTLPESTELT